MTLYIHIPFCSSRCGYCSFASSALPQGGKARMERYMDALLIDLKDKAAFAREKGKGIDSIYIGGGTPSMLPPSELKRLFCALEAFYIRDGVEISIEANPEVGYDFLAMAASCGVNRLSLGVQSFDKGKLAFLERRHDASAIYQSVEFSRSLGIENINADLIVDTPYDLAYDKAQKGPIIDADLARLLDLGLPHISCYSLVIEEGSRFYTRYKDALGAGSEELGALASMASGAQNLAKGTERKLIQSSGPEKQAQNIEIDLIQGDGASGTGGVEIDLIQGGGIGGETEAKVAQSLESKWIQPSGTQSWTSRVEIDLIQPSVAGGTGGETKSAGGLGSLPAKSAGEPGRVLSDLIQCSGVDRTGGAQNLAQGTERKAIQSNGLKRKVQGVEAKLFQSNGLKRKVQGIEIDFIQGGETNGPSGEMTSKTSELKDKSTSHPKPALADEPSAMHGIIKTLGRSGFVHYEVGNFALMHHESRHNLAYWDYEEYIGVGAGSVGCYEGKTMRQRYSASPDIDAYIKDPLYRSIEVIDASTAAFERLFLGLRCRAGVYYAAVREIVDERALAVALSEGMLYFTDTKRLCARDLMLADEIALYIMR